MKQLFACLFVVLLVSCGAPRLTNEDVTTQIKAVDTDGLFEGCTLEGISQEGESKMAAKITIKEHDAPIYAKFTLYDSGWQLDEMESNFGGKVMNIKQPPGKFIETLSAHIDDKRVVTAAAEVRSLSAQLEMYAIETNEYPESWGPISLIKDKLAEFNELEIKVKDPWGREYVVFVEKKSRSGYVIFSKGPNGETDENGQKKLDKFKSFSSNKEYLFFACFDEDDVVVCNSELRKMGSR